MDSGTSLDVVKRILAAGIGADLIDLSLKKTSDQASMQGAPAQFKRIM